MFGHAFHLLVGENSYLVSRGHVPKYYRVVVAAGSQQATIGAKRQTEHSIAVTFKHSCFFSRSDFPKTDRSIAVARHNRLPVRNEHQRIYRVIYFMRMCMHEPS